MSGLWIGAGIVALLALGGGAAATWPAGAPEGAALAHLTGKKLKASQTANAQTIAALFQEAGYGIAAQAAAITNAIAESGLNALAKGDGGHSIGLFQLNDWGAGKGFSVEWRQNPANNTKRILEVVKGGFGSEFRKRNEQGAKAPELAYLFCRDIERPADREGASQKRKALCASYFPGLA